MAQQLLRPPYVPISAKDEQLRLRQQFGIPTTAIPLSQQNYTPLGNVGDAISSIFNTIHQDIRDAVGGANQNVRDLVGGINRNARDTFKIINQDAVAAGSSVNADLNKGLDLAPKLLLIGAGVLALLLLTDSGKQIINSGTQAVNAGIRAAAVL